MTKFEMIFEERLKFRKSFTVETELSEDEFLALSERAERKAHMGVEEVADILDQHPEINVVERPDNDYSSPSDVDIEYWDHREE